MHDSCLTFIKLDVTSQSYTIVDSCRYSVGVSISKFLRMHSVGFGMTKWYISRFARANMRMRNGILFIFTQLNRLQWAVFGLLSC
ncbi:hypothetical protein T12_1414 [Trichinella patagoniensis]|uniref:Uncharacterized protein n=1 Tax=Trichinella patagoniensis TaxID=990121 RepID=A0A0V0ZE62_9BILA|nr:hypothetical protein T12_1414 [Trichinella patagoniensis]